MVSLRACCRALDLGGVVFGVLTAGTHPFACSVQMHGRSVSYHHHVGFVVADGNICRDECCALIWYSGTHTIAADQPGLPLAVCHGDTRRIYISSYEKCL